VITQNLLAPDLEFAAPEGHVECGKGRMGLKGRDGEVVRSYPDPPRDMAVFRITGNESRLFNVDLKEYIGDMSSTTDIKVIIESYQRMNALKGYFGVHLNKSLTGIIQVPC
jgi:hypothetical protein